MSSCWRPLDLCDTNATSSDVLSLGYQGSHAGSLALSNHGSIPSVLPSSGLNSSNPPPSGMGLGNNLSTQSGPMAASVRYAYLITRDSCAITYACQS